MSSESNQVTAAASNLTPSTEAASNNTPIGKPDVSPIDVSGIRVLKYGSDPLKTYLPDSDIDITVLCDKKLTSKCPLA